MFDGSEYSRFRISIGHTNYKIITHTISQIKHWQPHREQHSQKLNAICIMWYHLVTLVTRKRNTGYRLV